MRKIDHIASMIDLEDTKGEAGAIQKLSSSKYIRDLPGSDAYKYSRKL